MGARLCTLDAVCRTATELQIEFDWRAPLAFSVRRDFLGTGIDIVSIGPIRLALFQPKPDDISTE